MRTYTVTDSHVNRIIWCDSPQELMAQISPQVTHDYITANHYFGGWIPERSAAEVWDKARNGDDALADNAKALIQAFGDSPETGRKVTRRGIAGSICVVPAFLAGTPDSMAYRTRSNDDSAPIDVALSLSTFHKIKAAQVAEQGAALLALVMRLVQVRPVRLVVFGENADKGPGNIYTVCQVETSPLELAHACYVLAGTGFRRGIRLAATVKAFHGTSEWARDWAENAKYREKIRTRLGLSQNAIIVTAMLETMPPQKPEYWVKWIEKHYAEAMVNG